MTEVSPALTLAIIGAAGVAACLGTRALIPALRRAAVLDRPNERSSHADTDAARRRHRRRHGLARGLARADRGRGGAGDPAPGDRRRRRARGNILARRSSRVVAGGAAGRAMRRGRSRHRRGDAGRSGVSGLAASGARQGRGGAALGLVRQSLQFHGRHRRACRQRDGGDRYRAGAVRHHRRRGRCRRSRRRSPPRSPPPRSGFSSGTGRRRASFSAMSAACRSAI